LGEHLPAGTGAVDEPAAAEDVVQVIGGSFLGPPVGSALWVANSANVAVPIWPEKPLTASMTATIRSNRCRLSQRTPALHVSVRGYGLLLASSAAGSVIGGLVNPVLARRRTVR
jgi:hypothetical protein